MLNIISGASAIATLFLFILYFIGRLISMVQSMKIIYESIYICYGDEDYHNVIEKSSGIAVDCSLPNNGGDVRVIFIPSQPVFDFGIYNIEYDDETLSTYKISNKNLIEDSFFNNSVLSPGMAVVIEVGSLPDLYASYALKYKRFDLMKCSYNIVSDMFGLSSQLIQTKYSIQGIINNFVK